MTQRFRHSMRKLESENTIQNTRGKAFPPKATDIGTLRRASPGKPVVNGEEQYRAVIIDAPDFLLQRFEGLSIRFVSCCATGIILLYIRDGDSEYPAQRSAQPG